MTARDLLTAGEFSRIIGVHVQTVLKKRRQGIYRAECKPGREWLFSRDEAARILRGEK